jgi:hypothetical protein
MRQLLRRLERLEQLAAVADRIAMLALDVPGGGPDLASVSGRWAPVEDGRALLAKLDYAPKVYIGIDVHRAFPPMPTTAAARRSLPRTSP